MSNNSIPNIAASFSLLTINNNDNIVPHIYNRCMEYIKADDDVKLQQLKYVVVRQYLDCLLVMLGKNSTDKKSNKAVMQLTTIINSNIINNMEYTLPERVNKFLIFLGDICDRNPEINALVTEWDSNTHYF
jgi:hypothetical protein